MSFFLFRTCLLVSSRLMGVLGHSGGGTGYVLSKVDELFNAWMNGLGIVFPMRCLVFHLSCPLSFLPLVHLPSYVLCVSLHVFFSVLFKCLRVLEVDGTSWVRMVGGVG